jgi:hypothetical protein
MLLGFEVLTPVVKNVAILSDIAPCSRYVNRRFGGTYRFHLQGRKSAERETNLQKVARQIFLSSALVRREWLPSRCCRFNPVEDS